jgi:putative transposase
MEENDKVYLTFKYRLLPNKRQHNLLKEILESQRILYNAALESRIDYYRKTGKTLSLFEQKKDLAILRKDPQYSQISSRIQRWTIDRLEKAYRGFFRRIKNGEKAGFPRFKGKDNWNSFGLSEIKNRNVRNGRIFFQGIFKDNSSSGKITLKSLGNGVRIHLQRGRSGSQVRERKAA